MFLNWPPRWLDTHFATKSALVRSELKTNSTKQISERIIWHVLMKINIKKYNILMTNRPASTITRHFTIHLKYQISGRKDGVNPVVSSTRHVQFMTISWSTAGTRYSITFEPLSTVTARTPSLLSHVARLLQ